MATRAPPKNTMPLRAPVRSEIHPPSHDDGNEAMTSMAMRMATPRSAEIPAGLSTTSTSQNSIKALQWREEQREGDGWKKVGKQSACGASRKWRGANSSVVQLVPGRPPVAHPMVWIPIIIKKRVKKSQQKLPLLKGFTNA